jgi:tryptophan-rich sensory protein
MTQLSTIFPFPFMPPGWTFGGAWGAIYLALVIWMIWLRTQKKASDTTKALLPRYSLTCVLNILRITFTSQEWWIVSVITIIALRAVLVRIVSYLRQQKASWQYVIPFGLYLGRATMATTTVALSQAAYIINPSVTPMVGWLIFIMVLSLGVSGCLFSRYRNYAQLIMTLFALAGIATSVITYRG